MEHLPPNPENAQACHSGVCDLAAQASELQALSSRRAGQLVILLKKRNASPKHSPLALSSTRALCLGRQAKSLRERCGNWRPVITDRPTAVMVCCVLWVNTVLSTWHQDDQTKPQTVWLSLLPRGNPFARLLAAAPSDPRSLDPIEAALDCNVQTLALPWAVKGSVSQWQRTGIGMPFTPLEDCIVRHVFSQDVSHVLLAKHTRHSFGATFLEVPLLPCQGWLVNSGARCP